MEILKGGWVQKSDFYPWNTVGKWNFQWGRGFEERFLWKRRRRGGGGGGGGGVNIPLAIELIYKGHNSLTVTAETNEFLQKAGTSEESSPVISACCRSSF